MRAEAALSHSEEQIAAPTEKLANKTAHDRPAECHETANHCGKNQGHQQLRSADPGSDRGGQLHVTHAHAAHETEQTVDRAAQRETAEALSESLPASQPRAGDQPQPP